MTANTRALGLRTNKLAISLAMVVIVGATLQIGVPSNRIAQARAGGAGQYSFRNVEWCFMNQINRIRRNHGLRRLRVDKQLGYVARLHADDLAANQGLWHDYSVGNKVTRWRRLTQNTGRGGHCKRLIRSFMRSGIHRDNILGHYRHMGVGARWSGGKLYVQQLFESRRDPGNVYHYP